MTLERYMELVKEADAEMKAKNGHQFLHILKTRCQHCNRSPQSRGKCRGWFLTFVNILGRKISMEGHALSGVPPAGEKL